MPRIGYNNQKSLLPYEMQTNANFNGKGFCLQIYKIQSIFTVDSSSLNAIEDAAIRSAVRTWLNGSNEILKVFVLSEPTNFARPKFTSTQNPTGNIYYDFSDILSDQLPRKGNQN